ncbi:MAG: Glycosyl transferase group 1 [Candidatus Yanofskybacteria bacterium GW2011_GWA2_41_22]|uniref:Uncharacterized protein n=5 Tax=Parcubacteria group TaxID=1794811 RepID=A0A1F8HX49_9BACT|nr:MAG: Glycosyl transferase group 1 [Candidatus Yanofskybacteria bacterium GW2011_GWA2_41_22]KKS25130.1 MAG: Glycosyl transferase group 1 [Candidatus Jorgensenbacteria bacterium GW2011_GWF2_41_8]KKS27113.1 MAG: Glycosyl transferase group 1 [Candidatus Yanofskybacteria bacterium GW2011_GWC2_41_9]OGM99085.1 MAG: hypothetical protein A2736_02095 [Candidatus Yanofskybacteria bacterium RIFCSPHIGHO2_01_FULL_41_27]OGN09017.1 MAG: hypothetical protein A3C64_00270 [Candidatus Yanofskybacteria bacterium
MKIALVHDWLNTLGGAERVLIELHKIFPEAPIYTLFVNKKFSKNFLLDAEIRVSALQKIPLIAKIYKYLFFLMPSLVESFDLSEFDVVISSSVIFSKGLVLKPKTKHICYCYSPTRFLWDNHAEYIGTDNPLVNLARHFLRIWDRGASDRVDEFVAISKTVQDRIKKYYHRDAIVITPPIMLSEESSINNQSSSKNFTINNYYLIVSRLYRHKNINVAIDAFNKLGYNLVIVGTGPLKKELEKIAKKNIKFAGFKNDETLINYYKRCRAFIMPQEEDFGLTPIEAMSFGKPVLALRRGGALETVIEGITGEFFDDPIPEALADGIRRLNNNRASYNAEIIKQHTLKFSREKFKEQILALIANC